MWSTLLLRLWSSPTQNQNSTTHLSLRTIFQKHQHLHGMQLVWFAQSVLRWIYPAKLQKCTRGLNLYFQECSSAKCKELFKKVQWAVAAKKVEEQARADTTAGRAPALQKKFVPKQLLLNMPVQWSSTFCMPVWAVSLKEVCCIHTLSLHLLSH